MLTGAKPKTVREQPLLDPRSTNVWDVSPLMERLNVFTGYTK